jgi:hypothetical protein
MQEILKGGPDAGLSIKNMPFPETPPMQLKKGRHRVIKEAISKFSTRAVYKPGIFM